MVRISEALSAKFANLGFLAAVAVVFMHSGCGGCGWASWWFDELTTQGVFRAAVPFFFFSSGFFLAGHCDEPKWWMGEVSKRVRTILVPFLIWNVLYSVMVIGKVVAGNAIAGRPLGTEVGGIGSLLCRFCGINLGFPSNGPLWFLRSLFVFVILSPLLLFIVRRWFGVLCLLALYIIFDWQEAWRIPLEKIGVGLFSWEGLLYFALGMLSRTSGWLDEVLGAVKIRRFVLCAGAVGAVIIVIRAVCHSVGVGSAVPFKIVGISFLLPCILLIAPSGRFPAVFLAMTFPLYCLHSFVLYPLRIAGLPFRGLVGHLLLGCIACIGSALIATALKRTVPTFYRISFGGR